MELRAREKGPKEVPLLWGRVVIQANGGKRKGLRTGERASAKGNFSLEPDKNAEEE